MLLSEAFDKYRGDVIVFGNQSKKTEESHNIVKKSLISFLGDKLIEDVSFEDIRAWKEHISVGRSPKTIRGYIIKLRVVLAYLAKSGIKVLNPDLIPPPKAPHTVPQFITPEEVSLLIESCSKLRSKAIISLLYASGIRLSELISLDRSDIKDGSFTVVGKGGKARLCFFDERASVFIKAYLAKRTDNHPALFLSEQSERRMTSTNIQLIFKVARRKTGMTAHVTPHTMRHTFATNLLKTNMNVRYVQELLGHASLDTTMMYLTVTNHDLKEQYNLHHTI